MNCRGHDWLSEGDADRMVRMHLCTARTSDTLLKPSPTCGAAALGANETAQSWRNNEVVALERNNN